MQDLTMQNQQQTMPMPFGPQSRTGGMPATINAGAVAIEQERAIAEARGQMQLAKMFPRDLNAAFSELMSACKLPALASVAFYSKPQGGSTVTGPSIRLAEEIARVYGNFEFGHRELSRAEATPTSFGRSEIEVYAWDKEKNNRSIRQITVLHVLDTRDGPRRLRDQTDVDNKIANVASKQARGRILALLPKWLVEAAIEECKKTLAGNNDKPLEQRLRDMQQAFAKFGVTQEHLEKHLGHALDKTLADEFVELTGIFNSLREGVPASEIFGEQQPEDDGGEKKPAADLADSAQKARTARAASGEKKARGGAAAPAQDPAQQAQAASPAPAPADAQQQAGGAADASSKDQNDSSKNANEATQAPAAQPAAGTGSAAGSGQQGTDFF